MWYIQMPNRRRNNSIFRSPNNITSTNAITNELQSAGIITLLRRHPPHKVPTSLTGRSTSNYRLKLTKQLVPQSNSETGKRKRPNGPMAAPKKSKSHNNTPAFLQNAIKNLGIHHKPVSYTHLRAHETS